MNIKFNSQDLLGNKIVNNEEQNKLPKVIINLVDYCIGERGFRNREEHCRRRCMC